MASGDPNKHSNTEHDSDDEQSAVSGYKAPQKVDLGTIVAKDEDDDALTRYKNQLLGNANAKSLTNLVIDANDTRLVLPESITLVFENHKPDIVFDLKGSLAKVREAHAKRTVTIKEGEAYRTKLDFYVQRDIVTGLKLSNKVLKARTITVDKSTFMIGKLLFSMNILLDFCFQVRKHQMLNVKLLLVMLNKRRVVFFLVVRFLSNQN